MKRCFQVGLMLAISSGSVAAQDFSSVEIKTTKVSGSVYMLEGSGGNIGVSAGADGILIVDDQFAPLADKIRAALKAINPGKIEFVLNTHWHGDHTGGNVEFGPDAHIISHENVRQRLSTRQELFGRTYEPLPDDALPVITFEQSLSVHFNGEEIKVIHFPHGHTDGDSIVWFTESNVVHMGDLFFSGMFPFVDVSHGGDVAGLARNIEHVLERLQPDTKIIPGHGPLSTPDDLRAYHEMLTETTKVVRSAIASGSTLAEIQSQGLPERWRAWGTGFIKTNAWLEIIHQSLMRKETR